MNQTRKKITLPTSGATCVVRKLALMDFAATGKLPQAYPQASAASAKKNWTPKEQEELIRFGVQTSTIALLRACSPLTYPDGTKRTIVDKPLDEVQETEITIGELAQEDAQAIVDAAMELTNTTKEAGDRLKPFPEG